MFVCVSVVREGRSGRDRREWRMVVGEREEREEREERGGRECERKSVKEKECERVKGGKVWMSNKGKIEGERQREGGERGRDREREGERQREGGVKKGNQVKEGDLYREHCSIPRTPSFKGDVDSDRGTLIPSHTHIHFLSLSHTHKHYFSHTHKHFLSLSLSLFLCLFLQRVNSPHHLYLNIPQE